MSGDHKVHVLEISIDLPEGVPKIWRVIRIRGEANLAELNRALEEAFGWTGNHKHEYIAEDDTWKATSPAYGPPEFDESYKNEEELTIQEVASKPGPAVRWNYDIMDPWVHHVSVTKIEDASTDLQTKLTDGARAGIPEDVGGASGFQEFLDSLDPEHPDHSAMAAWYKTDCGNGKGVYDPEAIHFDKINQKLAAWTPEN